MIVLATVMVCAPVLVAAALSVLMVTAGVGFGALHRIGAS